MRSLLSIVNKNMRIIYRSKLSTFLVLLAPILIVFLIGSAFNSTSLNNIKVGTYATEYNDLINSMVTSMSENGFETQKIASSDECISRIKQGLIHVCVVFPDGVNAKGSSKPIVVSIDNSRMNIAYSLTNSINSKISTKGAELGVNMLNDILDVLKSVRDSLPTQKTGVDSAAASLSDLNSKVVSSEELVSQIDSLNALYSDLGDEKNLSDTTLLTDLNDTIESLNAYSVILGDSLDVISSQSSVDADKLRVISTNLNSLIEKLSIISASNAENIVSPIKTEINSISKDSSNWKYLYPTLVALILLLSGVVLSSSIVLTEKKERARFRNFMTPTSDLSFVLGAYLTGLIILGIQLVVLFVCTAAFTDLAIFASFGKIALVLFLASSVFLFIGMFIGYIFKSDETTILASISIAALLIFFSNAIIPVESIRGALKFLAMYNPFYIVDTLLKKIILFNEPLKNMIGGILVLVLALALFLVLCLVGRKMTKRQI